MKKYLLLTFFLSIFFGFSNISFAATASDVGWYGGTDINITTGACPSDGTGETPNIDFDPIVALNQFRDYAVDVTGDGYLTSTDYVSTPSDQKILVPGTTMKCFKWDGFNPTVNNFSYYNGWTNTGTLNINFNLKDTGGSGVKRYVIERLTSTNNPDFTTWSPTRTLVVDNTLATPTNDFTNTINFTTTNNTAYKFKITVYDTAGNSMTYDPGIITKIDKTSPKPGNISVSATAFLANNNQTHLIYVNKDNGSPINLIQGYFEDYSSCSNQYGTTMYSSTSSPLISTVNHKESKPGCDFDNLLGSRSYTYKITYVQDSAGNTLGTYNAPSTGDAEWSIDFKVYANTNSITTTFGTNEVSNITSGNGIANGSSYPLTLTLKDNYGNPIVPASSIVRTIDFNFNVNNTSRLDQYNDSGNAVYLSIPDEPTIYLNRLNTSTNFDSQDPTNITNGEYNFDFKIYAPINYGTTSYGSFNISSIKFDVNGTLGGHSNISIPSSNIDFSFKPIYETTITSEVENDGFIIGATQTGTINITDNGGTTSNEVLYLEFGSGGTSSTTSNLPGISPLLNLKLIGTPNFEISNYSGINYEGHDKYVTYKTSIGNFQLNTLMTQSGTVNNTAGQYLSSHIGYKIANPNGGAGLDVLYNSDIIGKTNYWSIPGGIPTNTNQGLKIGGISSSQNQTDITTSQGQNDLHIVGNISKTILKKDMRENVYNLINQVTPDNKGNKITDLNGDGAKTEIWYNLDGKKVLNDKVLYFNGDDVTLDSGDTLTGKKTIIVVGGNLYIKSNVVNDPTGSNILGIIVLKDDDGNGGNLYIDPDVTRLDAVIYTDKSLIGYDGTKELDGETDLAVLRNQLYINGSVFSENTIGGSIKNPLVCPYYVLSTDCDSQKKAQKYDLNFLRRYYYVSGSTAINGGKNYFGKYTLAEYPNYLYPVVIKYNPQIQSDPPPLFGN